MGVEEVEESKNEQNGVEEQKKMWIVVNDRVQVNEGM